ncbi:hypothetical protein WA556_006487 [Blastocystis sp. ATCC 50177/Nand II]
MNCTALARHLNLTISLHQCWNGDCLAPGQCPPLPACPQGLSVRCADASCKETAQQCPPILPEPCSGGMTRCWDGVCRESCDASNGCGLGEGECPDGSCVPLTPQDFEGTSSYLDRCTPKCVIGECLLTPVKTLHVPILMVISPFYDHSFPFIVDNTQVVAVVSIPSGIVSSLRMVLQFAPVAKSVLQATVRHYRLNYTVEQLFISSAFALSLHRFAEITRVSPFPAIDRVFSVPITVEFRNIRSPLFSTEDWCVGQLTTSGWQCASDIQHQPNGRLVAAIPGTGVYSVFYRIPVAEKKRMSDATKNAISALFALAACYVGILIPVLGVLAYLLKYRARLLRAEALLREDSALKSNAQEVRYNPLFTRAYIEFIDGDEKKGVKEQAAILKQQETIDLLEEEIREARKCLEILKLQEE